jgi:hypothetical protein
MKLALTLLKVPGGLADWRLSLAPQHSTVSLLVTPQVWLKPALTLWNDPEGGVA